MSSCLGIVADFRQEIHLPPCLNFPDQLSLLRSAATGLWKERGEVAFYVSSAAGLPATEWAHAIRGHWGIENRNHHVRDVSCDEDKSRIRDNPGIMARARSIALNILRKNGVSNVAQALWDGALSLNLILAYKAL
jgi:predicted transposase YbfD/YdcC